MGNVVIMGVNAVQDMLREFITSGISSNGADSGTAAMLLGAMFTMGNSSTFQDMDLDIKVMTLRVHWREMLITDM